jgi:cytosine/adenosine deaminase-related metal-dependent hydrolase
MATRAGAQVAGIDHIGSIAEGNWADVVLLSWPEIEGGIANQPLPDVMMHRAKASHVKTVIIGGKIFIQDGQWVDWDPVRILGDLRASVGSAKPRPLESIEAVKESVRKFLRDCD